ncbi:MAG TPA: nodulation protein NfeD [Bacteroidota bacterium]|nr:nodulation protein NfeD [Bacteroidota bacterium]
MIRIFLQIVTVLFWLAPLHSQTGRVYVLTVDGTINPASADYIKAGIQQASEAKAECLIIQLNTPGGLLKSTRVIVSDILSSPIPVIVYVSPSGAQAASAGVFVTLAAHIAVMASGTNIGAAHPVVMGEQQDSIMMQKATNDAAAFIRTISEKRNRNIKWAEDAVRKSLSITETEALREHVIDTIATTIDDLLDKIDNKEIQTSTEKRIIKTKGATIITIEKTFQQKILDILSDPNIAYIFMMLGIYGLLFELYNPGSILPGIVGFICLVLAFYSLHTLPINYAGLALIIFSVVLFLLEIKIVSHGLLTIGGVISLALGSIMLIQSESALEFVSISWEIIIITVIFTAAFFLFAIGMGIKAQRRKPTTGIQGLIGEVGETLSELKPEGSIRVHGEIWNAISLDGNLKKGIKVSIEQIENLKLKVRKLDH